MSSRLPDADDRDEDESNGAGNEYDEADGDDEDSESTVPCPYCKRQIHEDAERCPYCEQHVSAEDSPPIRKPWWIIIGAVVCLYLVFRWIAG